MIDANQSPDGRALDREGALARIGGDVELLREIAGVFLQEYRNIISEINIALKDGNTAALERNAHTLKGSVATFGTGPVFELAFELERIGRGGDLDGARSVLARLNAGLEQLRLELEAFIAE